MSSTSSSPGRISLIHAANTGLNFTATKRASIGSCLCRQDMKPDLENQRMKTLAYSTTQKVDSQYLLVDESSRGLRTRNGSVATINVNERQRLTRPSRYPARQIVEELHVGTRAEAFVFALLMTC